LIFLIIWKEKKEVASKEDDIFSEVIIKTKKQLENAVTLFKELMLRRRKKILDLILIAAETGIFKNRIFEKYVEIWKRFFDNLMKCINASDKSLNESLNGKKTENKKNELVCFLENVEEFVDLEGEKMGPYEKGQIANLPKEIINILVDGKKVERIDWLFLWIPIRDKNSKNFLTSFEYLFKTKHLNSLMNVYS